LKQKPNQRVLELIDEEEAPTVVARERRLQRTPYLLIVIDLDRSVHEAGGYETEDDYRQKDRYWFATLDEVEHQLRAWGYRLEDARDSRELDAP